jgi:hypothetical protein
MIWRNVINAMLRQRKNEKCFISGYLYLLLQEDLFQKC